MSVETSKPSVYERLGGIYQTIQRFVSNAEVKASVIGGDTIMVGRRHIRLSGIDAPNLSQTCKDANLLGHAQLTARHPIPIV